MRNLFFLFFLLSFFHGYSQEFVLRGSVLNTESKEAIEGASVIIVGNRFGAVTDEQGLFEIKFEASQSIEIRVSHINYNNTYLNLKLSEFSNGIKEITIELESKVNLIGEVPISQSKPDTVFGTDQYNVGDFAFKDEFTLLMVYEKEKRFKRQEASEVSLYSGCSLILLDEKNRELDRLSMDQEICMSFDTHYFEEVFLRCEGGYYLIHIENQDIVLEEFDHKEFDDLFSPIIDSIGDYIYVSTYSSDFPAFEYVVYNRVDSTYRTLHLVVDEPLMELFRSQYKYLDGRGKLDAFRYEMKTGIDKEIIAGYMSGFSSDQYYNNLYAPIFIKNDTLLVFDHYQDKLFTYNKEHEVIDSTLISYHKTKRGNRWKKLLLQDDVNGNIYSVYEKNGFTYLKHINCEDGTPTHSFKLHYKFVENWKIIDDEVYYIFRPFESSQKKYLYKERLY